MKRINKPMAIIGLVLLIAFPMMCAIGMECRLPDLGYAGLLAFPSGLLLLTLSNMFEPGAR